MAKKKLDKTLVSIDPTNINHIACIASMIGQFANFNTENSVGWQSAYLPKGKKKSIITEMITITVHKDGSICVDIYNEGFMYYLEGYRGNIFPADTDDKIFWQILGYCTLHEIPVNHN